ncbi:hypothetical protein [Helicobacter sp. 23-1045]
MKSHFSQNLTRRNSCIFRHCEILRMQNRGNLYYVCGLYLKILWIAAFASLTRNDKVEIDSAFCGIFRRISHA